MDIRSAYNIAYYKCHGRRPPRDLTQSEGEVLEVLIRMATPKHQFSSNWIAAIAIASMLLGYAFLAIHLLRV